MGPEEDFSVGGKGASGSSAAPSPVSYRGQQSPLVIPSAAGEDPAGTAALPWAIQLQGPEEQTRSGSSRSISGDVKNAIWLCDPQTDPLHLSPADLTRVSSFSFSASD